MEYLADSKLSVMDKLEILTDAAKYDVACTSSGTERKGSSNGIWVHAAGGCGTATADSKSLGRWGRACVVNSGIFNLEG